jgi:putative membrane protein
VGGDSTGDAAGGPWQDARVQFLIKVIVNAVAIWVATVIVPGVSVGKGESDVDRIVTLLVVGLIFGIVNAVIKPVVKLLALPFYILTLGLLAFVVNALLLELVAWLSQQFGQNFTIDEFFWSAVLAAVVVTLVSWALNIVLPDD